MTTASVRERLRFVEFEFRRLPSGGCQARVVLEWSPEQRFVGVAEGIASQTGALRCAAQAAVQESRALGDEPGSTDPIAAAARFMASPKRERFVFQSTLEAITTLRGVPRPESDPVRAPSG